MVWLVGVGRVCSWIDMAKKLGMVRKIGTTEKYDHCTLSQKIIGNLRIKTEPVTSGAHAMVYIWFLGQRYTI